MATSQNSHAAEAQSLPSIIATAKALAPTLERLLAGINAALDQGRADAAARQPADDNRLLESAVSLLKLGASAIDDDGAAEFSDVAEAVRLSGERITQWLGSHEEMDEQPAFDALDACTVVGALIVARMDPRNAKTISPITGVLGLAIDCLEQFLGEEPAGEVAS